MIPLYNREGGTSPLGMPMCQNRLAVPTWSYAMELHPPARILEFGSYNGGFATALGVHAWNIGARVWTFDRHSGIDTKFAPLASFLGVTYVQCDLYTDEATAMIGGLISAPGRVYVLSDCVKKGDDVRRFAPFLKSGDVIAAHDYFIEGHQDWWGWSEVTRAELDDVVSAHGLEPFLQEHFDMAAWLAFQKP